MSQTQLIVRALPMLLAAWSILHSHPSGANEVHRPRHWRELLLGTRRDVGVFIPTATIPVFNRYALERDFPYLKGLSDSGIEAWLLRRLAYLNMNQLPLTGIRNGPITYDDTDRRDLFVEPGAGRSANIEVEGGVINVKSNGNTWWSHDFVQSMVRAAVRGRRAIREVQKLNHRSGLEDQGMATAEYLRHLDLQEDFNGRALRGEVSKETVEVYALIDWGFDVLDFGSSPRAFGIARQANSGRTAHNPILPHEIYLDHGFYQETYHGARVDLGGARTNGEAPGTYHERAANVPPAKIKAFVAAEMLNFQKFKPTPPPPGPPVAELIRALRRDVEDLEPAVVPSVINHVKPPLDRRWFTETPAVAHLKYQLLRMNEGALIETLRTIPHDSLVKLFKLSSHDFQMPLPAAAYRFGFAGDTDVRRAAIRAATKVFDRFPELVAPAIKLALAHVNDPVPYDDSEYYEVTPEIYAMLSPETEYPGYGDLLFKALRVGNRHVRHRVIVELGKRRHLRTTRNQVVRWIYEHAPKGTLRLRADVEFSQNMVNPCGTFLTQIRSLVRPYFD